MKKISQGAEAIIYLNKEIVIKDRIKKKYRLPEIDRKITKSRTKKEAKLLEKARNFIPVPKIIKQQDNKLFIEYISGDKLSETLNSYPETKQNKLMQEIGKNLAKIHNNDIIHGDLTTSNIISTENKVFFIDFGLGFISKRDEDKAVDIHLLKQALEAKHWKNYQELFENFIKNYEKFSNHPKEILDRLKKVESRGRYRF